MTTLKFSDMETVSIKWQKVKHDDLNNGQTKRKILGCIFSEKLVLEKGRVATIPFTVPIQVLFKITKVLQECKNKKEVENNLLSTLAPQAGLPATSG
jgi:hypothetical protein